MNFGQYDRGSWWIGKEKILPSFIAAKTTFKKLCSYFYPHLKPVPFPGISHQPDDHIQPSVLQKTGNKINHTCATTTFIRVFATADIPRKLRV
jgi:hypothetical protein